MHTMAPVIVTHAILEGGPHDGKAVEVTTVRGVPFPAALSFPVGADMHFATYWQAGRVGGHLRYRYNPCNGQS
jgi:hypothetical protein